MRSRAPPLLWLSLLALLASSCPRPGRQELFLAIRRLITGLPLVSLSECAGKVLPLCTCATCAAAQKEAARSGCCQEAAARKPTPEAAMAANVREYVTRLSTLASGGDAALAASLMSSADIVVTANSDRGDFHANVRVRAAA